MTILGSFSTRIATPDLVQRLRRLADRLDGIRQGNIPSEADLAEAPRLDGWDLAMAPTGPVLVGRVTGHPRLGERTIFTSPVWVIDPVGGWALTLSRFYRLGASVEDDVQWRRVQ